LKNHALLLFGPSSFEHWFKSCKPFTVRPLPFSEITDQSINQFIPFLPQAPLLPLLCLPCSSAAGVMRRPCSPPATFCSPRPRVAFLLLTALASCCWHPTRAPRFFPGCQHCTPECRPPPQFLHPLALSFPLFYSVRSATLHCSFSLAQLLTKPRPTVVSPLFFFPVSPEPSASLTGIHRNHSTSLKSR
jgi:hypothetical protein